ncbi:MAG: alpha/beta hydrolase [Bacteroidia bacterium]
MQRRLTIVILFIYTIVLSSGCSTSAFFYAPYKDLKYYPDTTKYFLEEVNFKASDGKNLNGWFFKPKGVPVIGTVLHFHGNAGNISYQYQFCEGLVKAGFQVMVFDYEGFGKSEGKESQEHVLDDGISALHYIKAREDVKGTRLILFGQSLGGHLSCVVAAREQNLIDALVVEGAFSGHENIAVWVAKKKHAPPFVTRTLVRSKYDAYKEVSKITIPKLFIHSTEDQSCPYFMGKELYEKAIAPKEFWEIKGEHIHAAFDYKEEFVERFKKILDSK